VTGQSSNGTNNDYLTIKYDTNGNTIWQKVWDGGNNDAGCGIAVDSSGNVYVTGCSSNGASYWDYLTIKYNSTGDTVWQKVWDGGSDDIGHGIAVDDTGNVYVTGQSSNGADNDYLTIKYNGTTGEIIWQKIYNGVNYDYGEGIAVDSSGNVYVTGGSCKSVSYPWVYDYLTIKYRQY